MTRAAGKTTNKRGGRRATKTSNRTQPARVMRRYDGAKIDRLTADWIFGPLSANEEVKGGLEVLRNRARELERNNCHVRRFLAMVEANIVGRGFQLRIEGDTDGALRDKFLAWANKADVTGRLSWPDIQRLVARVTARDGETLVRLLRGGSYESGLGLQVLESDYLSVLKNDRARAGNQVVMSVEIDEVTAKPVAYHLLSSHPGDVTSANIQRTTAVPAKELVHVARIERPGQVRAVTWMSSVMTAVKMLQGYQEAEVVAARIASCKMGFYKSQPGEDYRGDGKDEATGAPISDATPGVFERLPTGWEFQQFDPTHPSGNYGPFVKAILREIAGGLGVAYNNFANDLDGVSYSSIRSGTIEEREQWIVLQEWFARSFLHPVFSAWLEMAALSGEIDSQEADAFAGKDIWTGRRWPWVDPQSDIAAKKEEIALGLTAPSDISAEQGKDYAATQARIKQDDDARTANGLSKVSQPAKAG